MRDATKSIYGELLQNEAPHSYNAMTHLVMALADLHKNAGRKTFFGRDKTASAFMKMRQKLALQMNAFILDGLLTGGESDMEATSLFLNFAHQFAKLNPNWKDAYTALYEVFIQNPEMGIDLVKLAR